MGRKKKEDTFKPSRYQEAIFDFIKNGEGNLVIEATAGSGKTSTLIHSLGMIEESKTVLFCAFNKDIVEELKKKIKSKNNVDIKTVHGLGYHIILTNLGHDIEVNDNKYRTELYKNIRVYSKTELHNKKTYIKFFDNTLKLINHIRYSLAETPEEIEQIIERHDISIVGDEIDVALQMIEWGKSHLGEIDFADMIWLPTALKLNMDIFKYDFVFCDEAQDISVAQRAILLNCGNEHTRYVFCGDGKQSIYAFADADPNAFKSLQELPNTTSLPLSISYRCPSKVIELAKKYSPNMECKDDCEEGLIKYGADFDEIEDGDMVLCRNNAPLMEAYFTLLGKKKVAYIRGKDIGKNLKKIVKAYENEPLNVDLDNDGVFVRLYESLFKLRDKIAKDANIDPILATNSSIFMNRWDSIRTLESIAKNVNTTQELIDTIDTIFSDKKAKGVSLSTIHKAKGLEADNVFILYPQLMPSKSAIKEWELVQEDNLIYVAYTRAKKKLSFINVTDEFNPQTEKQAKILKAIEEKVALARVRRNLKKHHEKNLELLLTARMPTLKITETKKLCDAKKNVGANVNPFASMVGHKKTKKNKIEI